jgi:hypothetical protein
MVDVDALSYELYQGTKKLEDLLFELPHSVLLKAMTLRTVNCNSTILDVLLLQDNLDIHDASIVIQKYNVPGVTLDVLEIKYGFVANRRG